MLTLRRGKIFRRGAGHPLTAMLCVGSLLLLAWPAAAVMPDPSDELRPIQSNALRNEYLKRLSHSQTERERALSLVAPLPSRQQQEQARWLKGRIASGSLEAIPQEKRRVWLGETVASVHKRLGKPTSIDENGAERYPGLVIRYAAGLVSAYELETAFFQGPSSLRVGMGLREVLKQLPDADGIFHQRLPAATESLHVLAMADGVVVHLQRNDRQWETSGISGMTGTAMAQYYMDLKRGGGVRRVAPDYLFSLESRNRPLP